MSETPKHVIYSQQTKIAGEYRSPLHKFIRYTVIFLIILMLAAKFVLDIDLYGELSTLPKMLLGLALVETLFFAKTDKDHVTPFEIQIFDDYIVIDEKKRYYHKNLTRRNICKIYYMDLEKIEYETKTRMFYIYGAKMDVRWYNYRKDGTLPDVPTRQKIAEDALWHFRLPDNEGETIIKQLKQYANIEVLDRGTGENLLK